MTWRMLPVCTSVPASMEERLAVWSDGTPSKYLAAFFHEKANILVRLGDSRAKDCFEQALAHCGDDKEKFRQQIQEELAQYF